MSNVYDFVVEKDEVRTIKSGVGDNKESAYNNLIEKLDNQSIIICAVSDIEERRKTL